MKTNRLGWILVLAAGLIGTAAAQQQTPPTSSPPTSSPQKPMPPKAAGAPKSSTTGQDPTVLKDIESTFGFVPAFVRGMPPTLLPSVWMGMKNFQLSTETKLDGKTKELIGLAVAAQIPCEFCVLFHTEAARMNGATDVEIQEAVGMAAITREVSTMLNGTMVDKAQFKKDLDRIMRHAKQQARK